jgi:hypothetical protein
MAQRENRPAKDPIANPGSHGGAPRPDTFAVIARNTGHSIAVVAEVFSERSAIREYLGGMTRADAEIKATQDTSAILHSIARPPPCRVGSAISSPTRSCE